MEIVAAEPARDIHDFADEKQAGHAARLHRFRTVKMRWPPDLVIRTNSSNADAGAWPVVNVPVETIASIDAVSNANASPKTPSFNC